MYRTALFDTCGNLDFEHTLFVERLEKLTFRTEFQKNTYDCKQFACCDEMSKDCMFRECDKCKNRQVSYAGNPYDVTYYEQWVTENINRSRAKGLSCNVQVTTKKKFEITKLELVNLFNKLFTFLKHVFIVTHQLKTIYTQI